MNRDQWLRHRGRHLLQSAALLAGMAGLLAALGLALAGSDGVVAALLLFVLLALLTPRLPASLILRLYGARAMPADIAWQLEPVVAELAQRAGLPRPPMLAYLPSRVPNALTLGRRDEAWIGLTDGLLRRMDLRELAAVLAHEISHIRNNDLWLMELAGVFQRLTHGFALTGLLLLIFSLPLLLIGTELPSLPALLLMIASPGIATLLQLALSRVREFDADLEAVRLTGDPQALASALSQMELADTHWLRRLLLPGRDPAGNNLLRSHPPTRSRIERLLSLAPARHRYRRI